MILELQAPSATRWKSFVLVYSPLLRFWISRKQVPSSATEDILQECLKSIFLGIGEFRRHKFEAGSFRGWLRTIVNRRIADYFRNSAGDKTAPPELLSGIEAREERDPEELLLPALLEQPPQRRALPDPALRVPRFPIKTQGTLFYHQLNFGNNQRYVD